MSNQLQIEKLFFQQFQKPQNYLMTKIINVYNNRYRINVYVEFEENNLTKRKIAKSYFCRYYDGKLDCDNLKVSV